MADGKQCNIVAEVQRTHAAATDHRNNPPPALGSGARFAALKSKLAGQKGIKDPGALAAAIGRKKYGAAKMAKMSAAGRKGG